MNKTARQTAQAIVDIIKIENIVSVNVCLTRLRLKLKASDNYNIEQIQYINNVIKVIMVSNCEIQIVLGPSFVTNVKIALEQIINYHNQTKQQYENDKDFIINNSETGAINPNLKRKNNRIQNFFIRFSNIFSPMIIGFIGAGVLAGIAGIIQAAYGGNMNLPNINNTARSWYKVLNLILEIWKNVFIIIVGWRTCEIFGGSGVIGAMIGIIYCPFFINQVMEIMIIDQTNNQVNFIGIKIKDPLHNWLTIGYQPEWKILKDENGIVKSMLVFNAFSGNIIAILFSCTCAIYLEKAIHKIMPKTLDAIGTPTITLFLLLLLNFFLIIPLSSYLYLSIAWFFAQVYPNPFGAFTLSTFFVCSNFRGSSGIYSYLCYSNWTN